MKLDSLWTKRDMRYSRNLTSDLITSEDLPITSQDDTMLFQSIPTLNTATAEEGSEKAARRLSKMCELPIRVKTIMGRDQVRRRVISTPANFKVPDLPRLEKIYMTEPPSASIPRVTSTIIEQKSGEEREQTTLHPPPKITREVGPKSSSARAGAPTIINRKVRNRVASSKLPPLPPSALRHASMPQSTSFATYSCNKISANTIQRQGVSPSQKVYQLDDGNPYTHDYSKIIQIYLDSTTDHRPPVPLKNSPLTAKFNQLEQEDLGLIPEDIEFQLSSPESLTSGSEYDELLPSDDIDTINSLGELSRFITADDNLILPKSSGFSPVSSKTNAQNKTQVRYTNKVRRKFDV